MSKTAPFIGRRQRGFSIIELMVGMVVALLVGVAATSSAMLFGAAQRQGIGVGGTSVNANSALAALKNDAAAAGLGFFGNSRFLCSRLNLSLGGTAHWNGTAFSPVRITRTADQDVVDVLQADRVEAGASVILHSASTGTDAELRSFLPARERDAVLLSSRAGTDPCTVRSVTRVIDADASMEQRQRLEFAGSGVHNGVTFATAPTYTTEDLSTSGVTLLGALLWQRYRLDGTNLLLERPLAGESAVVARNVIAFRAQYGVSAGAGDNRLASWEDATGDFAAVDGTTIERVRAVRVAVVLRSPQREKANADGVCEASTDKPRLFAGTADEEEVEPDVSDWRCFRYRNAVLVIPMRNLVMGIRNS